MVRGGHKSGAHSFPCCPPPLTASQEGRLCAGIPRTPVLEGGPHSLICAQLVSCHLPTCAEQLPQPANRKSLTSKEAGRGCLARLRAQGLWSGQEAGVLWALGMGAVGWVGIPRHGEGLQIEAPAGMDLGQEPVSLRLSSSEPHSHRASALLGCTQGSPIQNFAPGSLGKEMSRAGGCYSQGVCSWR